MIRTFIYGSCVSRDTYARLPSTEYSLVEYIARQSLISSTSPRPEITIPAFSTASSFQERMIQGDWNSSLLPALTEHADDIDLILWDLCDERLGVYDLSPPPHRHRTAPHSTRSVDSISSGLDSSLRNYALIPFATTRHRLRFNRALTTFAQVLHKLNLLDTLVIVAPPWATSTAHGMEPPQSFNLSPARANRLFESYQQISRKVTGAPVATSPAHLTLADPHHKWGLAPFHYTEEVYEILASNISRLATGKSRN